MLRLSSLGLNARTLGILAVFAATTACTTEAVSPVAPLAEAGAAAPAEHRGGGNGGHRHRGRYRDHRHDHGRRSNRSGSAVLSANAVLGADGITRLVVTSSSERNPDEPAGSMAKVQVKVYGPDGRKLFTKNFQGTTGPVREIEFPGLPAGARFAVQAEVRNIDRNRTDVVCVTVASERGPALGTTIRLPDVVVVGVPTTITAIVRETNGDQGTNTACVLFVDGREVDRVDEVWVDAGDAVTCAFTYAFSTSGQHDVRVSLVNPEDSAGMPPAPSSSGQVTAADPNRVPSWQATVLDRTVTTDIRYDLTWWNPNGSHKEYEQSTGESPRNQTVSMTGTLARATTFPLSRVQLVLSSNAGGVLQSQTWNGLTPSAPVAGQSCVSELVPEQGGQFTLCSTGTGYTGSTTFGYTRFAGTVTYHSRGFNRVWDNLTGTETYWTWNDDPETYAGGGQMRQLGTSVGISLAITDNVGAYNVNAAVPLTSFSQLLSEVPYTCAQESPWWLEGGVQTVCEGRTERASGWSGSAAG